MDDRTKLQEGLEAEQLLNNQLLARILEEWVKEAESEFRTAEKEDLPEIRQKILVIEGIKQRLKTRVSRAREIKARGSNP